MFGCADCERRRQWLKDRARESSESIKRALTALTNRTAKPVVDSAEQSTESTVPAVVSTKRQTAQRGNQPSGSNQ